MIRYIDRDEAGNIAADYANRQHPEQEEIEDDAPEFVAALAERTLAQWRASFSLPNWKGVAILKARNLHATVTAALAAIPDATTRLVAQTAFDRADFPRASPMISQILKAAPVGYTDAEIDQLFRDGDALSL